MLANDLVDLRGDDGGFGLADGRFAGFAGSDIPAREKHPDPEDRANRDNLQIEASVRPDQRV